MDKNAFAAVGIVAAALLLGLVARAALGSLVRRCSSRAGTRADDLILQGLRDPLVLWFFLAGVRIALRSLDLPPFWDRVVSRTIMTLFILSVAVAVSRLLTALVPPLARRLSLPATSLTNNLVHIAVYFFAGLMLLANFGVSVGPFLTALGVGTLAVGLALQETLGNLFAGFYLLVSREVRVGDRIEMERGIGYGPHKGTVLDIGWRSSRLEMEEGRFTIVPNAFVTQSIITVHSRETGPPRTERDRAVGRGQGVP